jgi:acetoin utilization protein AcuC
MKSFLIYSEEIAHFEYSRDHPFRPERARMFVELCNQYHLLDEPWIKIVAPKPIPEELLLLFHTEEYLETLKAAGRGEITEKTVMAGLGTSDNPIFPDMYKKSSLAGGGTLVGLTAVLQAEGPAFAFNPTGGFHHAYKDHAEGFCYINDIAVCGKMLRRDGLRFCYIDIDVHHGNGVQEAFYEDDGALVISLHQDGRTLYPGTGFEHEIGREAGKGYTINIPLPPQTDDTLYLRAFYEIVPPAVAAFSPDVLLVDMGTDTMANDPLANFSLTNNSIEVIAGDLKDMAEKIVGMGAGGYNLDNATRAWAIAWAAINGIEMEDPYAGIISGMMRGPEIIGGDLSDPPIYVTGPTKEKNEKEIDRIIASIKKTVFPILGAKG